MNGTDTARHKSALPCRSATPAASRFYVQVYFRCFNLKQSLLRLVAGLRDRTEPEYQTHLILAFLVLDNYYNAI